MTLPINRFFAVLVVVFGLSATVLSAKNFAFPPSVEVGETTLEKVGESLFRWTFFKVYDGALYLPAGVDPEAVLTDVPKRLELAYYRGFPAQKIAEAGDKKLRENIDDTTFAALSAQIAAMNALYVDLEEGDRYALTYVPGEGTTLSHNGQVLGTVAGTDFANAYYRIWLGEKPVGKSFRDALLGKK